jgi:MFS transporter, SP family, sugar:H+ symporter
MGLFSKKKVVPTALEKSSQPSTPSDQTPFSTTPVARSISSGISEHAAPAPSTAQDEPKLTLLAVLLGAIASMGGFIFGYESGQISGALFFSASDAAAI